ncbi:MAG: methyltransferase, TrmH family [Clostridia bacterium]|nr:methyltransferase, TrmH family [Clostridia bacterium]
MKEITSINNRYIKLARSLRERSVRNKKGFYLIEGIHLLEEARISGIPLEAVFFSPKALKNSQGYQLAKDLDRAGYRCLMITEELMEVISTAVTPPGVLAIAPIPATDLNELLKDNVSLIVVADGIQDPGNLGTIWRTALGAGAKGLVLTHGSVDPFNPKVVRSAMGATFKLPVVTDKKPKELVEKLFSAGLKVVVADVGASVPLWQVDLTEPLALVVGNENKGPDPELTAAASGRVIIPMVGPLESLNVSVAAAILLYETVRQRQGT